MLFHVVEVAGLDGCDDHGSVRVHIERHFLLQEGGQGLAFNLHANVTHKCEAVPNRARIQGS